MGLHELTRPGGDDPPKRSLRILRKLREEEFPAPLTVRRFESVAPPIVQDIASFRFDALFGDTPWLGAAVPVLGASIGNILDIPMSAAQNATDLIMKSLGVGVTEEEIAGVTAAGSKVRDVTDVTIPLSELEGAGVALTEDEIRVRNFKRFLQAGASTLGNIGGGGLHRGYEIGALAEPEDEREQVADLAGMILADIGVTLPFIPMMAAVSGYGVAKVAASTLGRGARAAPLLPGIPQALGGKGLLRSFNTYKAAVTEKFGTDVGLKVAQQTAQLFTRIGVDLEVGFGLGGLHVTNMLAMGEDLSPEEIVKLVGLYTVIGLGFGTVIHGVHALGMRRSLSRWQNAILSGPYEGAAIGLKVGDLTLVGKGPAQKSGARGASWKNSKGEYTKAPTPEEIGQVLRAQAEHAQAVAAAEIRFEEVPPVLPGLLEHAMEIQTSAATWAPGVRARAGQVGESVLRAEMEILTRQASDVGLPPSTRISLLGRARAIQRVLGELQPEAGVVSLPTEIAAVQSVMNMPREAAMKMAAGYEASGNSQLATRIINLLDQDLPQLKASRIDALLGSGEAMANRGLVKGDRVRDLGNKQYVLLEDPSFGTVTAKEIKPAGQNVGPKNIEVLSLNEVITRPKAGTTARLKDGQVVEILEAEGGTVRNVKVKSADGKEATYSFEDIAELGHDPRSAKSHQRELRRARRPSREGAEPVVPAVVSTPEGEVGVLVASGPKGKVVRTAAGERVVREVRSTKETPDAGGREVLAFAPGTRPDPDNHILFAIVSGEQAAAFEAAYQSGGGLGQFLQGGVHVLPPTTAGRGAALYAIELPRTVLPNKAYSPAAKQARKALSGKPVRVDAYSSPVDVAPDVVARSRVYRVPEALHAKGQRPETELAGLRGEERTTYLRRLLDFTEDVETPVAEALARRRTAQESVAAAQAKNDGAGMATAKKEVIQSTADAADAVVIQAIENAERSAQAVRRHIVATDVQGNGLLNRALSGDETALGAIVEGQLARGEGAVLIHKDTPGRTLLLQREVAASGEVGQLTALIEEGGKQVPYPLAGETVAEVLQQAKANGFLGGLHQRTPPGSHVLDGNPYLRASVEEGVSGAEAGASQRLALDLLNELRNDPVRRAGFANSTRTETARFINKLKRATEQNPALAGRVATAEEFLALGDNPRATLATEEVISKLHQADLGAVYPRGGHVRVYQAERLAGSDDVVWRLDAVGEGAELEALGFVREGGGPRGAGEVAAGVKADWSMFKFREDVGLVADDVAPQMVGNDVVLYHGTSRANADLIASGRNLKRDDFGGVGVSTTASEAQVFGSIKGAQDKSGPTILEVRVNRDWLKGQTTTRDIGGSGRNQFLIRVEEIPPEAISSIRMFDDPFAARAGMENVPPPYEVGPGGVRTYSPLGNKAVEDAAASLTRGIERQEWAPVYAELASSTMTDVPGTAGVTGRYRPTGQAVKIIDAPLDSPNVSIEFFDGKVRDVAKSEVRPGRLVTNEARDFRIAQDAGNAGGSWDHQLAPPSGLGALERELGLFGTDRPSLIRDRAVVRAQEHLDKLSIKDGEVFGSPEAVESLTSLYDRAIDLEFAPDILKLIPKDAQASFIDAAYQATRRRIPDEVYSLLYAGAKYDKLVPKQVEVLRKIGADHNLSRDLPPHRIAEDLWNKRLIDPLSAEWTLNYRQDLGVVRLAGDANLDPSAVALTMRPPRASSWPGSRALNPSHFELAKNPTMQAFESSVRAAHEGVGVRSADLQGWGRTWRRRRALKFPDGTKRKANDADFELIWGILEEHGSWEGAVKAKAVVANDPRKLMFNQLRERMEVSRELDIRLQLLQGTESVDLFSLPEAVRLKFFSEHPWVDPVLAEQGGYWIVPGQLDRFRAEGLTVKRSTRTEEDVTGFLALLKRHDTSESLPPEITGWQRDQFDLWKRFGIENYVPRIHRGEIAVEVQTAAGWQPAGYATSVPEATLLYRQLRTEGRFGKLPYRLVHRKAYADDIIQESMSKSELFTWVNSLRNATIADDATLAGLFLPSAGRRKPSPVGRKPVKGAMLERTTDLRPPKRHPWQELQMYEQQLARSEQRFKVAQAYRTFLDRNNPKALELDIALNEAEGGVPLFGKGNEALARYAETFARDAIGLPNAGETALNQVYNYWQMLNYGPRVYVGGKWDQFVKGEQSLSIREVFDPEKWQVFGAARQRASEIVGFQAQWRMAMGPATALVNGTQYHLYTAPMLHREFGSKAAWAARGSWFTAARLWRAQQSRKPLTGALKEANDIADAAGVNFQVGRHLAGASGLAGSVQSAMATPVTFGAGRLGAARAWGDFIGMYMFNSAERVNRLATALASYKAATYPKVRGGLGLGHEAAIAKTREIIGSTQFWYDELNLPQLMRQGGPAARVLLQFKPFMMNALRYEVDMASKAVKGLARGDLRPAAAMSYHAALYGVYGGAMGVLRHPVIAGTLWAMGALPFVPKPTELRAKLAGKFGDTGDGDPSTVETLLLHGAPGVLNMSLGGRLGFTGQEIASLGGTSWLGPHISTMADFTKAVTGFAGQAGSGTAVPGMAIGFLAPALLPGKGGQAIAATPFSRMLGVYASQFGPGGEKWREWLDESPEGRRFIGRLLPSFIRNGSRAVDVYQHGFYLDTKGRRIEVPYGDESAEAAAKLGGFPTRRDEERQAYLEWLRPRAYKHEVTKSQLARAAAAAWSRGDLQRAHEIVLEALEAGIFLEWSTIENQIERSLEDQVEGFTRQLPAIMRRDRPGQ